MKYYPSLPSLLAGELGTQCPALAKIDALAEKIRAEFPHASHVIYFRNGHWLLLPAGPGTTFPTPAAANTKSASGRQPRAYCPL